MRLSKKRDSALNDAIFGSVVDARIELKKMGATEAMDARLFALEVELSNKVREALGIKEAE